MSSDQQAKTPNRPDRVGFVRKYALTFVIFVFVEVSGVILEEHKEWVPWLANVELKAHGWLSSLEARTLRVQRVVTVEIDDEAYFIHFGDPGITPRDKLATLAKAAADVDAAVIALDGKRTAYSGAARAGRSVREGSPTPGAVRTFRGSPCLAFSPDSLYLASSDEGGTIVLWNPNDGTEIRELPG